MFSPISIRYILALSVGFIFVSCKKDYTCECTTVDPRNGFINPATYHVKEKNNDKAMQNCAKQYEQSGKATGGINCEVN